MSDDPKVLYCPGCENKFGGKDKIKVKGGLILCPNCSVELKPIRFGTTINMILADEYDFLERRKKNG